MKALWNFRNRPFIIKFNSDSQIQLISVYYRKLFEGYFIYGFYIEKLKELLISIHKEMCVSLYI